MPGAAVFLDRDGVLNRTFVREGVSHPPQTLEEFELLPNVEFALKELDSLGYPLIVVTNQPDVARGVQTRAVVEEMNALLKAQLPILDVLTCYHDTKDACACRKPKPGMLIEAARRYGLTLPWSFMIGDRWSDVVAGQTVGCTSLLVATPQSGPERCAPDACVSDLSEAVSWITNRKSRGVA